MNPRSIRSIAGGTTAIDQAVWLLTQAGAGETAHPSGTLLAHLRGTYETLRRWGCPEHLRTAGLFHSVYSTDAYPTAAVSLADRHRVRERIGEPAEALAYLYCAMARRSLYENLSHAAPYWVLDRRTGARIELDGLQQLADLLTLDLANRLEQLPRTSMSLRRLEADRRLYEKAASLLPAGAAADLRHVYRRRSPMIVLADGLLRRARRMARPLLAGGW